MPEDGSIANDMAGALGVPACALRPRIDGASDFNNMLLVAIALSLISDTRTILACLFVFSAWRHFPQKIRASC